MTRRKRTDPPLTLTRVSGARIAGRDEDGNEWQGIDATKGAVTCHHCGERIQYGYAPLRGSMRHAHCVKCVKFVDAEIVDGKRYPKRDDALTGAGLE